MTTPHPAGFGTVERAMQARRDVGGKCLVPYVTAGITESWLDYVAAAQDGGADAVEIGLPFSDPMLDGPIIQAASSRALVRGSTVGGLLDELAGFRAEVPLIVMTYSNIARRHGYDDFCHRLAEAGLAGLIVADTPVDEVRPLVDSATSAGLELTMLVAPSTSPDRVRQIGATSRGFVYVVSIMGVTGVRDTVSDSIVGTVQGVRDATMMPVLVGFGVSTPEQAATVASVADGVVVASALMRSILDGAPAGGIRREVDALRVAVDSAAAVRPTDIAPGRRAPTGNR
ncbi:MULTISPECIES: tryptophan synthase subunit alpha [Frankia]|uniref:tryptophan synthase subunit alpha n=1 Tax=Frankia TaxID=1854 RepID=UPI000300A880|nr:MULTISPECIES: tryptophan synthase subunit alpha [Frankia]